MVKNKTDFLICHRVWKAVECQGKIREKSGNFEVDDRWQPCITLTLCKSSGVLDYPNNSKIWDTSNNCHNCSKNRKVRCNIALMHPKDADGMANSVDPDQTASSEAV